MATQMRKSANRKREHRSRNQTREEEGEFSDLNFTVLLLYNMQKNESETRAGTGFRENLNSLCVCMKNNWGGCKRIGSLVKCAMVPKTNYKK
jgi:hypothetical protein